MEGGCFRRESGSRPESRPPGPEGSSHGPRGPREWRRTRNYDAKDENLGRTHSGRVGGDAVMRPRSFAAGEAGGSEPPAKGRFSSSTLEVAIPASSARVEILRDKILQETPRKMA